MQLSSLPTHCAVEILDALRGRNMERLNAGLARAAVIESACREDPHECERAELLGSVAGEMQAMIALGRVEDTGVFFNLLEHLAHSRPAARAGEPSRDRRPAWFT